MSERVLVPANNREEQQTMPKAPSPSPSWQQKLFSTIGLCVSPTAVEIEDGERNLPSATGTVNKPTAAEMRAQIEIAKEEELAMLHHQLQQAKERINFLTTQAQPVAKIPALVPRLHQPQLHTATTKAVNGAQSNIYKPPTTTHTRPSTTELDTEKIKITEIDRSTIESAKNSKSVFDSALTAAKLYEAAYERQATDEEKLALHRLIFRFVAGDSKIVSDIRQRFGTKPGRGDEIIKYVTNVYIENNSRTHAQAKEELKKFKYSDLTSKDGNQARDKINELMTIREQLDPSVQGNDEYWISEIIDITPALFQLRFDIQLRKLEPHLQRAAAVDLEAFIPVFSAAVDDWNIQKGKIKEKDPFGDDQGQSLINQHQRESRKRFPECTLCKFTHCPKAKDNNKQCDVHGFLQQERVNWLAVAYPKYCQEITQAREKAGKKEIKPEQAAAAAATAAAPAAKSHPFEHDPAPDYKALAMEAVYSYNFPGGNISNLQETEDYKSLEIAQLMQMQISECL